MTPIVFCTQCLRPVYSAVYSLRWVNITSS